MKITKKDGKTGWKKERRSWGGKVKVNKKFSESQ